MGRLKHILLWALVLTVLSCGQDVTITRTDCPTEIVCTDDFVTLTFSPQDNGEFIELDSYYTLNLDNGAVYYIEENNNSTNQNIYVIITDDQIDEITKEGSELRFFGIKNDQVVLQQDFTAGHDCCHVIPIAGPFEGLD